MRVSEGFGATFANLVAVQTAFLAVGDNVNGLHAQSVILVDFPSSFA